MAEEEEAARSRRGGRLNTIAFVLFGSLFLLLAYGAFRIVILREQPRDAPGLPEHLQQHRYHYP